MATMFLINKLSIYLLTDSQEIIYPVYRTDQGAKKASFTACHLGKL